MGSTAKKAVMSLLTRLTSSMEISEASRSSVSMASVLIKPLFATLWAVRKAAFSVAFCAVVHVSSMMRSASAKVAMTESSTPAHFAMEGKIIWPRLCSYLTRPGETCIRSGISHVVAYQN